MWTRIGGRYSGALAWIALALMVAPFVALSVVSYSPGPTVFIAIILLAWILASLLALAPVAAVRWIVQARSRPKRR